MASIFDLKTNVSELAASNAGVARNNYEQYAPLREINESTFAQGQINFRFETTGTKWWVPNKTYFRVRCRLSDGNSATLSAMSGIAPNVNLMNNIFQSAELQVNNRTVSKITDFMGQISMLETRLTKTKQWKENVGKKTNLITPSFSERQQVVVSDGFKESEDSYAWTKQSLLSIPVGDISTAQNTQYATATCVYDQKTACTTITFANTAVSAGAAAITGGVTGGFLDGVTCLNTFKVGDILRITTHTFTGQPVHSYLEVTSVGVAADGTANNLCIQVAGSVPKPLFTAKDVKDVKDAVTNVVLSDITLQSPVEFKFANVRNGNGDPRTSVIYFSRGRKENIATSAKEFELIWTPPLSIFKVPHAIPPGARVDIFLNPHNENTYQFMAIETLPPYSALPTDFKFNVTGMFLYVNTLEGARVESLTYLLDLESTVCFSENISNNEFSQKNFDVPTSTYALTLAYQDRKASASNTIFSPSKFHVGYSGLEKYVNRFYISYAGQQLPQPDADPAWDESSNKKLLTQRWAESLMYSNGHLDPFVTESETEWLQYGPYFHFAWPRDAADRSTRVQIFQQFDTVKARADMNVGGVSLIPVPIAGTADVAGYLDTMSSMKENGNMLLFAHYREVARITIQDSRVVNVELEIA